MVNWKEIQPQPGGKYDFGYIDDLVRKASERGTGRSSGLMRATLHVITAAAIAVGFAPVHAAEHNVRVERTVQARMRDGVKLMSDMYQPESDGKLPVLLGPHAVREKALLHVHRPDPRETRLHRGDPGCAGARESEGTFEPFFDDEKDGFDSVEGAAALPQSTGKVRMILTWYGAAAQIFCARRAAASGDHFCRRTRHRLWHA